MILVWDQVRQSPHHDSLFWVELKVQRSLQWCISPILLNAELEYAARQCSRDLIPVVFTLICCQSRSLKDKRHVTPYPAATTQFSLQKAFTAAG